MIDDLRKQIDLVDAELIDVLNKRMGLCKKIGDEKRGTGEKIQSRTREVTILDSVKLYGNRAGLDEDFVTNLYQVILAESRRIQGAESE